MRRRVWRGRIHRAQDSPRRGRVDIAPSCRKRLRRGFPQLPAMIRRALRILLGLVVAGGLLLGALGLWLRLGGARWAGHRVLREVHPFPGPSIVVGPVGGNLLRSAEVRGVELRNASGAVPARVERVRLRYSPDDLLSDEITIDEIEIVGATVRLKRRPDGTWELPEKPARKPGE